MKLMRLAILGSTKGTNMQRLIDAIQSGQLAATIQVVLSNKSNAAILTKARDNQLPAIGIDAEHLSREAFDEAILRELRRFEIDLIVLIGYMRILPASFIEHWRGRIINVHPSLLPAFSGKMDREVHQAVLEAGVIESGCTVHQVIEMVDMGPIVIQKKCGVFKTDEVDTLRARVQALEGEALIEAIQQIASARHESYKN